MKTPINCLPMIFAILFLQSELVAQDSASDTGIFSGRGIDSSRFLPPPVETKSRWPKLLNFSNDANGAEPRKENRFKSLFSTPSSFEFWKNKNDGSLEETARPDRGLGGFSDLFPKRDPDRPGVLQQWSQRSKSFFSKTADWAHETNANLRTKSYDTWDAITRDVRGLRKSPTDDSRLSRPPRRSSDESLRKPRVRF